MKECRVFHLNMAHSVCVCMRVCGNPGGRAEASAGERGGLGPEPPPPQNHSRLLHPGPPRQRRLRKCLQGSGSSPQVGSHHCRLLSFPRDVFAQQVRKQSGQNLLALKEVSLHNPAFGKDKRSRDCTVEEILSELTIVKEQARRGDTRSKVPCYANSIICVSTLPVNSSIHPLL